MTPAIDPRRGDIEDDASSPKRRSMLSLTGSLLVEISLPKLVVAWLLLIVFPGLMLGLAPIVASIWFGKITDRIAYSLTEIWSAIFVAFFVGLGWFGGRRVFQLAERGFWSLNSLAVQPCYTVCREALRHLLSRQSTHKTTRIKGPTLHATTAVLSGLIICTIALLALLLAWPSAHLLSDLTILSAPKRLAIVALANSVVIVSAYVAAAALVWAIADATMDPPHDLEEYDVPPDQSRSWRIVHLSDIHTVGERFGFRIESGRSGPRGNERLRQLLAQLDALHAAEPLHAILMTGDMTDAGRSTEWAEFFDAIARYPSLAGIMLILPGNHDLNIVDRANPARLDLPMSQNKKLRKVRMLSAMVAVQGARVRLVDQKAGRLGESSGGSAGAAFGQCRCVCRCRKTTHDERAVGAVEPHISDGVAARPGRRPRRDPVELERRYPFFLHQRPWHDAGRTSPRHRNRQPTISACLLADRAASSCRRIPSPCEGSVRTHRDGFGQRELVCPRFAVPGRPCGLDARSSPRRLDWDMLRTSDRVGSVPGHGCDG